MSNIQVGLFLKLHLDMINKGMLTALGPRRFTTLVVLASFMNEEGECYPTQAQVAKKLGVLPRTAFDYIHDLLDFRWNGKPIVERQKEYIPGKGIQERSIYRILPLSQVTMFNGSVEPIQAKDSTDCSDEQVSDCPNDQLPDCPNDQLHDCPNDQPYTCSNDQLYTCPNLRCNKKPINKNQLTRTDTGQQAEMTVEKETTEPSGPKDVIESFCHKYRERYNVNYSVNWGRDVPHAKKLLADFTVPQIQTILDTVFERFDTTWKTDKYPRPSLGQLATWLGNKALALPQEEDKRSDPIVKEFGGRDPYQMLQEVANMGRRKAG
ncbi:hypothetical protein GJ688_12700 [Heliobacillus mobilis]|uniref:Helix-turn-helix domain-containing protein n=1 Tax=Heliobacterium mobile TaxID=28064 RepID=A0A6I3SLJ8_HELMO|nr:helix-turn-helix domain-containing protein [Heliobacterium mobile]MTV49831.1 hypothetical protein [Heliobacterium mobile]